MFFCLFFPSDMSIRRCMYSYDNDVTTGINCGVFWSLKKSLSVIVIACENGIWPIWWDYGED